MNRHGAQSSAVAAVDFRIGGDLGAGEEYQFSEVRGLALLPDYRFVVADYMAQRVTVYNANGHFIATIGRVGQGPGEFDRPSSVAVDPGGSVWVYPGTGNRYDVWSIDNDIPSYIRSVSLQQPLQPRKPVFTPDGLVGLTGGDVPLHGLRFWVDLAGNIVREHALPEHLPGESLGARRFTFPGTPGSNWIQVSGPFAIQDWLAYAPDGTYARCVTQRYEIDLYDTQGVLFHTITRELLGPRVSKTEREREEFVLDSLRAVYRPANYPRFQVPDRKPPVKSLWYDEDGRLWVQLWEQEGDTYAIAHVYDNAGGFLLDVRWPPGVSLRHGAIRGDVGVGLGVAALDVPEVVRMTFRGNG